MNIYKSLYQSLATGENSFTLLELAAMISALEMYSDALNKLPEANSSGMLIGEIKSTNLALNKVKKLYKLGGGPKLTK